MAQHFRFSYDGKQPSPAPGFDLQAGVESITSWGNKDDWSVTEVAIKRWIIKEFKRISRAVFIPE